MPLRGLELIMHIAESLLMLCIGAFLMNVIVFLWRRLQRWGRFQALVVLKNSRESTRTRGEIDRELWDQKAALERASQAALEVEPCIDLGVKPVPAPRILPDPPCEVEPPEVAAGPVRSASMIANPTRVR